MMVMPTNSNLAPRSDKNLHYNHLYAANVRCTLKIQLQKQKAMVKKIKTSRDYCRSVRPVSAEGRLVFGGCRNKDTEMHDP